MSSWIAASESFSRDSTGSRKCGGNAAMLERSSRVASAKPVNDLMSALTASSDSASADSICASHSSSMCAICCSGVQSLGAGSRASSRTTIDSALVHMCASDPSDQFRDRGEQLVGMKRLDDPTCCASLFAALFHLLPGFSRQHEHRCELVRLERP